MKQPVRKCRAGVTLLEIVIASTMLAVVVAAVSLLVRSARETWAAHTADYGRIEAAHATVNHIVRRARQAVSVSAISGPAETSGNLSLLMPSGDTYVWEHDGAGDAVNFGTDAASNLLAEDITGLKFTAYKADGTTQTTDPTEVQSMRIETTVQLPRETGGQRTVDSWAWIRSW